MTDEIIHHNTDKMVCPYCGVKIRTYGWGDDLEKSRVVVCPECEKTFAQRNRTYTYTKFDTEKIPCANGEGDHVWSHWVGGVNGRIKRICKKCDAIDSKEVEAR
jgi:hypothetical protein